MVELLNAGKEIMYLRSLGLRKLTLIFLWIILIKRGVSALRASPGSVSAYATTSHSIRVTWKPPGIHKKSLEGYYVGYKIAGSPEPFIYQTVEIGENFKEECFLTNLKPNTNYRIVIKAFHSRGTGPFSKEKVVKTPKNDPPLAPPITVKNKTIHSMDLSWDANYDKINPVSGYILHHKPEYGIWNVTDIVGVKSSYLMTNLECGTKYHFSLKAYNSAGNGAPSGLLVAKTDGEVPLAPDEESMMNMVMNNSMIDLGLWQDGGCPIFYFIVKYKRREDIEFNIFDGHSLLKSKKVDVLEVSPGSLYQIHVSATNSAGTTNAEYLVYIPIPEAPDPVTGLNGYIKDAETVRVYWDPPKYDPQLGVLERYYVGYKISDSPDAYVFEIVEMGEGYREKCTLTNLKRNTKYSVIVQAYYSKGAGPPTGEFTIVTPPFDEPLASPLTLKNRTTEALHLAWDTNYDKKNPVSGYILKYRRERQDVYPVYKERLINITSGNQDSHWEKNLICGAKYYFTLYAYNSEGKGPPSEEFGVYTEGGAPLPPEEYPILNTSMTTVVIKLESWQNNWCKIFSFRIKYKPQQDIGWTTLYPSARDNPNITLSDLSPGTLYEVEISATNVVGKTTRKYIFQTLDRLDTAELE